MKTTCPICQSTKLRRVPDPSDAFRIFSLRCCADCGHQWEPRAPGWLLVVGGLVGVGLIIEGVRLFVTEMSKNWFDGIIVFLLGVVVLTTSVDHLRRRRRKGS